MKGAGEKAFCAGGDVAGTCDGGSPTGAFQFAQTNGKLYANYPLRYFSTILLLFLLSLFSQLQRWG